MKQGALFGLALVAVLALWFGSACLPGNIVADYTQVMDTYHLSVICERFGHHLSGGHLPLWFPEFGGGYPGHALSMYGFASPGALIWALLPLESAYAWSSILHIALGGVGIYALLREQGLSRAAAMCGGVVFALSEYTVGRASVGHVNQLWALAWAPWVMRATLRAVRGERGAVGWLGIWSGLALISGHVQLWFFLGPAIALYAAVESRSVESRGAETPGRAFGRVVGGAALGLLVATVQWLPSAEFMSVAERPEPDPALFAQWSAPFHVLAAKVAPRMFGFRPDGYWGREEFEHELSGVGGLAALLLVLLALRRGDRRRTYFVALGAVGLVLALGAHTAVTNALHKLPLVGWGRVPARTQILTLLAAGVLSGHAVEDWLRGAEFISRKRLLVCVGVALGVAVAALGGIAAWSSGLVWPLATQAGSVTAGGAWTGAALPAILLSLGGGVAVVLTLLHVRRQPRHALALPIVVALASLLATAPPVGSVSTDFLDFDWGGRIPAAQREHRVHLADLRTPHIERSGVRTFRRLAHVETRWMATLTSRMTPPIQGWMDTGSTIQRVKLPRGPPVGLLEPGAVQLLPMPAPPAGRALVFRGAESGVPDERVAERLASGERVLVLAEGGGDSSPSAAQLEVGAGTARVVPGDDPCRLAFDVDAQEPGWLFVTEKYYPGWTASVGGHDAEIHRANVAFRAVRIPAGVSRVVFTYRPWSVYGGALVTLLTLAGCLWLVRRDRPAAE